jgi:hypothetical protein
VACGSSILIWMPLDITIDDVSDLTPVSSTELALGFPAA